MRRSPVRGPKRSNIIMTGKGNYHLTVQTRVLDARLEEKSISTVLDTGSQVNLLSEDIFENILNRPDLQQTSGEDDAVLDFMGNPTGVLGKTHLILSMGEDEWHGIECLVV